MCQKGVWTCNSNNSAMHKKELLKVVMKQFPTIIEWIIFGQCKYLGLKCEICQN